MLLQSSEPDKVINFISSKIKNFFIKYPNFKLFLLKLQFFRYILLEKSKDEIKNFYITNIFPLIKNKSNYNEIEKNLFYIFENEYMIKNRIYQSIWEECTNLFIIGLEIALNEILKSKNEKINHKCNYCKNCKDRELYRCRYGKIETIEEEIINKFKENDINMSNNRKFSFEINSINSDNFDYFEKNETFPFDEEEFQIMNYELNNNNNFNINNSYKEENMQIDSFLFEPEIKGEKGNKSVRINNINDIKINNCISNRTSKQNQKSNNNSLRKQKLKEFQFKFTKRENIDKKILRKFRKFLKDKSKKNFYEVTKILSNSKFWYDFITQNLMPPFNYLTEKKEFKSFNTTYMSWVFEHKFSLELYNIFIKYSFNNLCEHFQYIYHLNNNNEEFNQLKIYLNTLPLIFSTGNSSQSNIRSSTDCGNENRKELLDDEDENNNLIDKTMSLTYLKDNDIFNELIKDKM